MSETTDTRPFSLIGAGLLLLLLWSVLDYGGRYLHVQAVAQALTGGILILLVLSPPETPRRYPLTVPILLLMAVMALSWLFSVNRLASLEEILRYGMYVGLTWVVYHWCQNDEQRQQLLKQIVAVGLLVCVMGWWQKSTAQELVSTFHRTNDLAGYLLLLWPLTLHQFLVTEERLWKLFYGVSGLLFLVSLVTTNSRSAWGIGLLTTLLLLGIFHRQRLSKKSVSLILGCVVLGVGAVLWLNWSSIGPRIASLMNITSENATAWRLSLLQGAWAIFTDHPFLGSGPNTFATIYHAYQQEAGYYSINPHNYYMQLLAEMGLAGLVAFLTLMVTGLWVLWQQRQQWLIPGLMLSLMASLLQIGVEIAWSVSAIPILFFVLLGLGLSTIPINEETVPTNPALTKGVQIFVGLVLVVLPTLNYFSVRAFVHATQAIEQQDLPAAQTAIKRAIALAPWPSGRHYHLLGRIHWLQKDYVACLTAVNRALQLDHHQSDYYLLASQALTALKEKKAALDLLLRMIEVNPKRHPDLYAHIGDHYWLELNQPQTAQQWYLKATEVFSRVALARYETYTPTDRYQLFNVYRKIARLYHQQGKKQLATHWEQQATSLLTHSLADARLPEAQPTPYKALQVYWQTFALWQKDPAVIPQFQTVMPNSEVKHPRPDMLFQPTSLKVLSAQRTLDTARFVYQISFQPDPKQATSQSITLQDDLMLTETGWQIYQRQF